MRLPFRYILTVSELTREIKDILETQFADILVEGEISNLKVPPSGHIYFTLKDDFSQIRGVLFRNQARALRFSPEDGLHVICRGRVSLYEKRGEYQLILEEMEPKGIGALQLAFLQLKERLEREGLFDPARKKPIPMLPQKIGIVTSPTGAVIRDMLQIFRRRFENVHLVVYPVRVQGEGAASEIAEGIEYFNEQKEVDVIIVARGGGSLEDLWAFNEEEVARAIFHSQIPVISAVGHETDYTISDFVADVRAPTPSAAAELAVKDKRDIKKMISFWEERLENEILQIFREVRTHLLHIQKRLKDPRKGIEESFSRLGDLFNRFLFLTSWTVNRKMEKYLHLHESLLLRNPSQKVKHSRRFISEAEKRLVQNIKHSIEILRQRLETRMKQLDSLSPLSILQRGYSITQKIPSLKILRDSNEVSQGDRVHVKLFRGALVCGVEQAEKP
ncbi:MAG: exodeoxyribonuclease VII large subunit [Thermodesulfobacteriota bacterium]